MLSLETGLVYGERRSQEPKILLKTSGKTTRRTPAAVQCCHGPWWDAIDDILLQLLGSVWRWLRKQLQHFVMALVCSLLTCCLYPVLMTCLSVSTLQQINLIILLHVHNLLLPVFASSSLSKSCFVNQATWLCSGWFCTCLYCFSPSSLAPTRLLEKAGTEQTTDDRRQTTHRQVSFIDRDR